MRRRANRLRMLEEQCVMLHQKLRASTDRSETLSTKLAELHDHYGPSDSTTETPSDEHPKQHQDEHASSTEKGMLCHGMIELNPKIPIEKNLLLELNSKVERFPLSSSYSLLVKKYLSYS